MSDFCIDAKVLGTENHLVIKSGMGGWSSIVPPDIWHFSGEQKLVPKCLDTALKLARKIVNILPESRFVSAAETIFSSSLGSQIPWQRVLPVRAHRSFLKGLISEIEETLKGLDTNYYDAHWVTANQVFTSLQPAKIDIKRWRSLTEQASVNKNVIASFEPDSAGYASQIVYDRFGSRTGRLTVASGPQILTVKREFRNVITSEYGNDGSILALDFNAQEVRALLYECGKTCPEADLYAYLGSVAFDRPIIRNTVKGAIISELYGLSQKHLAEKLEMSFEEAGLLVRQIRAYFELPKLLKKLRAQHVSTKLIQNHYGRPLEVPEPTDSMLINTFAQSTGVDVALLGFAKVIELLRGKRVRPLFVLHDALILDCHNEERSDVKSLKTLAVPGYEQLFALKCEELCTQSPTVLP